jgi:hypothetical protein
MRYPTGGSEPPDGDQFRETLLFATVVAFRFDGGGKASVVALIVALGRELTPDIL